MMQFVWSVCPKIGGLTVLSVCDIILLKHLVLHANGPIGQEAVGS